MQNLLKILSKLVLSPLFWLSISLAAGQKGQSDNFISFINELSSKMPISNSGIYVAPSENEMMEWSRFMSLFQYRSLDSCRRIMSKFNYEVLQMKDGSSGDIYDIIKEKNPVQKGWGTYIYNRNSKKRLYVHINHPLDDAHALVIGAELFRSLKGEWLLIAGTSRYAIPGEQSADAGRLRGSIFQKTHEILSNLTHVAISLHSYNESSYQYPINVTDIIISNGKTSDEQWGISQISLAFRDSLRAAGFYCGLAMYDSGYARLSGGWNYQGVFSNDSVGFGHWLYLELSKRIREKPSEYNKLVHAIDRALDLTGKKISHQVNRAFGLVSPRVIRLDSLQRLFFPPDNAETYRIISMNVGNNKNDTIDLRIGNWIDFRNTNKSFSSVTMLDSTNRHFSKSYRRVNRTAVPEVVSKIVKPAISISSMTKFEENANSDSSSTNDEETNLPEPLQVHRIPLKPVLQQTYYSEVSSNETPYIWTGIVPTGFSPEINLFEINKPTITIDDFGGLPKFIIPILSNSYDQNRNKFLGLQMTNLLMNEIARLITEYQVLDKDIGMIAEQSDQGDYYLRLFPNIPEHDKIKSDTENN